MIFRYLQDFSRDKWIFFTHKRNITVDYQYFTSLHIGHESGRDKDIHKEFHTMVSLG